MKLMSFLRQSGEERTQRVLTGSVYGTMLFLAVPSFLMLISQALATTFDNWFILNYSDLSSSGAVSYGMQAFNVIYNAGIGLSVAGTAILSRFNGQGDWENSRHYTKQFIMLMFLLSLALGTLTFGLSGFYADMALEDLRPGVRLVMKLYAISIPFAYFNNAYYALKNAVGKSEIPFVFTFLMVFTKVVCNSIFVAGLRLGVLGIGLATICSHLVVSLVLLTDMTSYADALAIVSNRMDQIPSKDSMPGSLYSDLAKIYEKAVQFPSGGSITIIAVTTLSGGDITHAVPDNTGYITEGQLFLRRDSDIGKVIVDPFRSLSRLKQLVTGKKTRKDHPQVMNAAVRLYADAANAKTKLENGFDLTNYDERTLAFAKDYSNQLLAIDVNLDTTEMLDVAWSLFGKYFRPEEVNIKKELVDQFWPKAN